MQQQEAAPTGAPSARRAARPTFADDAQYAPLVAIFDVSSLAELDDVEKFPFSAFKQKAAEHSAGGLRPRSAACFTSYKACLKELLTVYAPEAEGGGAGGGGQQLDEEAPAAQPQPAKEAAGDADVEASLLDQGLALVHTILAGSDVTEVPDMTDDQYKQLLSAFEVRMAEVEAGAKAKFEEMKSADTSVEDICELAQVRAA